MCVPMPCILPPRRIAQMCSYDAHHRTSVRRSCKQPNGWFGSASDGACLNKYAYIRLAIPQNQPTPKNPAASSHGPGSERYHPRGLGLKFCRLRPQDGSTRRNGARGTAGRVQPSRRTPGTTTPQSRPHNHNLNRC